MRLTRKGPTADQRVRLAYWYDDRSPPDDRKSIRDGRKASVGILHQMLPRIYAGTFAVCTNELSGRTECAGKNFS